MVLRLNYGATTALFTGDIGADAEAALMARGAPLRAEVLKVGHHGSAGSSTAPFLAAVRPRVALIGVGKDNRYGHPTKEALDRLAASPDGALAAHRPTVAVQRREPDERGDLLAVERTELRQRREKRGRYNGADARDRLEQVVLFAPDGALPHTPPDVVIELVDLLLQPSDVLFYACFRRVRGADAQAISLRTIQWDDSPSEPSQKS